MKHLLFPVLVLIALNACRRETPAGQLPDSLEPDFVDFYQKFHRDSLYQVEHIVFPLQGLPAEADSLTLAEGRFYWQQEDWVMHHLLDPGNREYQLVFTPLNPDLIIEKIVHKPSGFGMMRRWARMGDDWFLIYYAAMNRLAETENKDNIRIEGGY